MTSLSPSVRCSSLYSGYRLNSTHTTHKTESSNKCKVSDHAETIASLAYVGTETTLHGLNKHQPDKKRYIHLISGAFRVIQTQLRVYKLLQ